MIPAPWQRARLALELLSIDPVGLGGLRLRARAGPARDLLLALLPRPRRLDPRLDDEALFGGTDVAATLACGRLVRSDGLIAELPALLLLPMAERATPAAAARVARLIEAGHCVIALDESAEPGEGLASCLDDRLGLHAALDGCALADCAAAASLPAAAATLADVTLDPDAVAEVARLAAHLGIASLRPPIQALRAARAVAARAGRRAVEPDDLALAVALVLAPRAVALPDAAPPPPDDTATPEETPAPTGALADVLLDAVRAALPTWLPPGGGRMRGAKGTSGSGARRTGETRGRPRPSRPGRPGAAARIDVIATLRAAAPWQTLRRASIANSSAPAFRVEDLRLRRYEERADRLLILAVDASGSTAHARLAEAKGAVELLLGGAYVRRDRIALIAFRGVAADVLLPPTRSLAQARRRLAALPGGGATPLALGLRAALELADRARDRGMTPSLALLTDGRANVALDGRFDRAAARGDATAVARTLRSRAVPGIVIDTGLRPEPQLSALSATMAADYLPLPHARAAAISAAVSHALVG